jgi:Mrp family chromosome partitioning ATPase
MSLGLGIGQYARSTGRRVLLMDLDLRKPRLAKQLGIVLERDLSDVALAGAAIAEAIRRERQTGCDVLALRDPVTDPLHFASTDAMHAAVQHGRKGYDLVLMIGPTDIRRKADVAKLAALADLAILVLPWGIPSDAAKAAVRELRGNKTRTSSSSINAVLTGVPSHEIDLAMSPEGPNGTP